MTQQTLTQPAPSPLARLKAWFTSILRRRESQAPGNFLPRPTVEAHRMAVENFDELLKLTIPALPGSIPVPPNVTLNASRIPAGRFERRLTEIKLRNGEFARIETLTLAAGAR